MHYWVAGNAVTGLAHNSASIYEGNMNNWTRPSPPGFGGHALSSGYYQRAVRVEPETSCNQVCKRCLCKSNWRMLFYVLMGSAVTVIFIIVVLLTIFFVGPAEGPSDNSTAVVDENAIHPVALDGGRSVHNYVVKNVSKYHLSEVKSAAASKQSQATDEKSEPVAEVTSVDDYSDYVAMGEAVPVNDEPDSPENSEAFYESTPFQTSAHDLMLKSDEIHRETSVTTSTIHTDTNHEWVTPTDGDPIVTLSSVVVDYAEGSISASKTEPSIIALRTESKISMPPETADGFPTKTPPMLNEDLPLTESNPPNVGTESTDNGSTSQKSFDNIVDVSPNKTGNGGISREINDSGAGDEMPATTTGTTSLDLRSHFIFPTLMASSVNDANTSRDTPEANVTSVAPSTSSATHLEDSTFVETVLTVDQTSTKSSPSAATHLGDSLDAETVPVVNSGKPSRLPSFEGITLDNTGWNPLPDDKFYAWLSAAAASSGYGLSRVLPKATAVRPELPDVPIGNAWTEMWSTVVVKLPTTVGTATEPTVYTGAEVLLSDEVSPPPSLTVDITLADDILSEFQLGTDESNHKMGNPNNNPIVPQKPEMLSSLPSKESMAIVDNDTAIATHNGTDGAAFSDNNDANKVSQSAAEELFLSEQATRNEDDPSGKGDEMMDRLDIDLFTVRSVSKDDDNDRLSLNGEKEEGTGSQLMSYDKASSADDGTLLISAEQEYGPSAADRGYVSDEKVEEPPSEMLDNKSASGVVISGGGGESQSVPSTGAGVEPALASALIRTQGLEGKRPSVELESRNETSRRKIGNSGTVADLANSPVEIELGGEELSRQPLTSSSEDWPFRTAGIKATSSNSSTAFDETNDSLSELPEDFGIRGTSAAAVHAASQKRSGSSSTVARLTQRFSTLRPTPTDGQRRVGFPELSQQFLLVEEVADGINNSTRSAAAATAGSLHRAENIKVASKVERVDSEMGIFSPPPSERRQSIAAGATTGAAEKSPIQPPSRTIPARTVQEVHSSPDREELTEESIEVPARWPTIPTAATVDRNDARLQVAKSDIGTATATSVSLAYRGIQLGGRDIPKAESSSALHVTAAPSGTVIASASQSPRQSVKGGHPPLTMASTADNVVVALDPSGTLAIVTPSVASTTSPMSPDLSGTLAIVPSSMPAMDVSEIAHGSGEDHHGGSLATVFANAHKAGHVLESYGHYEVRENTRSLEWERT